jgi:hypothetical protein
MKKRNESGQGERAAALFPDGGTVTAADRHERAAHDSGTGARDTLTNLLAWEVTRAVEDAMTALIPAIAAEVAAIIPELRKQEDRLLNLDEVAARLGCGKQRVMQRMARGEIIWTQGAGGANRRVKESRLDEYIAALPEYRGEKQNAERVHMTADTAGESHERGAAVAADRQDGGADARGKEKVA